MPGETRAAKGVLVGIMAAMTLLWAAVISSLHFQGPVTADGGDYVTIPFDVPAGTAELRVEHADGGASEILDWGVWAPEGFRGWGRVISDFDTGRFAFETVKPGAVPGRGGKPMAPHLNLWIVARGINIGLSTRMYFSDEPVANAADPVLGLIENPARWPTLIAAREERDGMALYRFDIRLQGENETVFFDV